MGGLSDLSDGLTDGDEGNLLSGNGRGGLIFFTAVDTQVQGNLVGTDVTGMSAIANNRGGGAQGGINFASGSNLLIGGTNAMHRNIISGNQGAGIISWGGTGLEVRGNWIGLAADGATAIGNDTGVYLEYSADGVVIDSNVISGNDGLFYANGDSDQSAGIVVLTQNNSITNNIIGLDPTQSFAVANLGYGVSFDQGVTSDNGGPYTATGNTASGNVVAGNLLSGFWSNGESNTIENNFIGTTADLVNLGNQGYGIVRNSDNGSVITGNTILFNQLGVFSVSNSTNSTVSGNTTSFYSLESVDGIEDELSSLYGLFDMLSLDLNGKNSTVVVSVANGILSLSGLGDLSFLSGNNTSTLTLEGGVVALVDAVNAIQYTPNHNYFGSDSVSVSVTVQGYDATTSSYTDVQNSSIEVAAVNDDPTTSGQNVTISENTVYQLSSANFPFSDIDNSTMDSVVIKSINGGVIIAGSRVITNSGAIDASDLNNGLVFFRPNENQSGTMSVNFQVSDGEDTSSTATLTFNVLTARSQPPQSSQITYQAVGYSGGSRLVLWDSLTNVAQEGDRLSNDLFNNLNLKQLKMNDILQGLALGNPFKLTQDMVHLLDTAAKKSGSSSNDETVQKDAGSSAQSALFDINLLNKAIFDGSDSTVTAANSNGLSYDQIVGWFDTAETLYQAKSKDLTTNLDMVHVVSTLQQVYRNS